MRFFEVSFSDLSSQQTLMISSGDPVDLVLALWEGGITNYADKGAVMAAILLNEIKNKFASRTYQTLILLPYLISWVIVSYLVYAFLGADTSLFNNSILKPTIITMFILSVGHGEVTITCENGCCSVASGREGGILYLGGNMKPLIPDREVTIEGIS